MQQKKQADEWFPVGGQVELLIASSSRGDMATKASLLEFVQLLEYSMDTRIEVASAEVTYESSCIASGVGNTSFCATMSVLDLFFEPAVALASGQGFTEAVRHKIGGLTDTDIKEILGKQSLRSWHGASLRASDIMGGVSGEGNTLRVEALMATLFMKYNPVVGDGKEVDEHLDAWETAWSEKLLATSVPSVGSLRWHFKASNSDKKALVESLQEDRLWLNLGVVLLVVYASSMLGRPHLVRSRLGLGLVTIFGVVLALIATMGIASSAELFWGPVHSLLPLLMFGIGMDNAFVISNTFDRVSKDNQHPLRERIALALSRAGTAVTVTSVTNSCAFLIGSMTEVPALRTFGMWAGVAVAMVYLVQTTFFVACLTLDARRQEQGRIDCLLCKRKEPSSRDCCGVEAGILQRLFQNKIAPCVLRWQVAATVLVLSLSLTGICAYGASSLYQNFSPSLFYLDDTSIKHFDAVRQQYFPEEVIPLQIYTGSVAYESKSVQQKMLQLCSSTGVVSQSKVISSNSTTCWYEALRQASSLPDGDYFAPQDFYSELQKFLGQAGVRFKGDLQFDTSNRLLAARFHARLSPQPSNEESAVAMDSIVASVDSVGLDGAFPFTFSFLLYAQYAILEQETFQNVGTALVVVFLVSLLMLGNPIVCFTVFLGVAMTVVELLGILHFWDINLNVIAVSNLAVAVGLSVDFSAHIGLEYLECVGTPEERITQALGNLGPSLVHGGFSTFLVIAPLSLGRSYIADIFFKMFTVNIGLGMFHGFIIVPAILSFLRPDGFFASETEKKDANVRITTMKQTKKNQDLRQAEKGSCCIM